MRKRIVLAVAGILPVSANPALAGVPASASCPGQDLSVAGPAFGADLGAFIAFEARNPGLEGWANFGEEVSTFALSDRDDCPAE